MTIMSDCLFCKIVSGDIPAQKVYEDEHILAFKDINPKADIHVLVIPKHHITNLTTASESDWPVITHLLKQLNPIAKAQGAEGYRVIANNGEQGGQEVFHMHWHILANAAQGPRLPGF